MYDAVLAANPDHVELVYYPGNHGDRIADYANYTLNWLSQYTRPAGDTPSPLSFSLEWTGQHFWMGMKLSSSALREAHWVRVRQASFDRAAKLIQVDAENLKPQTGDGSGAGVPPSNLTVNLTFDLARLGLPLTGPYTIERIDLGSGAFSVTYVTPVAGILEAPLPAGLYMYRIVAGNQPPTYQTLVLQQGASGYSGAQDTSLNEWAPDLNYGAASELRLYHTRAQPTMKILLRFDLSQLPASATVRSAVLSVRVTTPPKNAPRIAVDAYRVNRPWAAAQATWNRPATGQSWSVAGAEGVPGDRAETASDRPRWVSGWRP